MSKREERRHAIQQSQLTPNDYQINALVYAPIIHGTPSVHKRSCVWFLLMRIVWMLGISERISSTPEMAFRGLHALLPFFDKRSKATASAILIDSSVNQTGCKTRRLPSRRETSIDTTATGISETSLDQRNVSQILQKRSHIGSTIAGIIVQNPKFIVREVSRNSFAATTTTKKSITLAKVAVLTLSARSPCVSPLCIAGSFMVALAADCFAFISVFGLLQTTLWCICGIDLCQGREVDVLLCLIDGSVTF